ncbi:hypothetical protein [Solitalea canadensis]|uniref:Lipoprotein n=1 Tax=Solitalea canadensis (strain ATCC 29591 / DSM 3403 / JCM 21819 / LMG 8368 / NBRC 15130 / NCIMB 12057 / USAM 9D) TaxID=929556 RepID=H8KS58_SOLCM|nr:hypothetical protein [Solitalea canadensis]AFD07846.1 hypothetical protein Solca_2820 [Solitalea canadensis DSM 3403]
MQLKKITLLTLLVASATSLVFFSSCDRSGKVSAASASVNGKASANADAENLQGSSEDEPVKKIDPEANIPYEPIKIDTSGKWIVKGPKPLEGAILPDKRIIAFYGNLYSKKMGVLGEYPTQEMLTRLDTEVKKWEAADPKTPVQPALHLIIVTAQGQPGKQNRYSLRMPYKMIDSTLSIAKKRNAIVFLDIQVGHSTLKDEIPLLEPYLKLPNVHLGIDAEFSMKDGSVPGKKIGTFDAADINYATEYLQGLVKANNIPPKLLIVHRFTQRMITNSKDIKLRREVQVVMHMDGWGPSSLKRDTYRRYIYKEPVQYTGFKLFFKNDIKCGKPIMTPSQVLTIYPQPLYIQYQ